jgi:putative transposase
LATVTQAYRFALDPTPRQRRALASHCGAARVAYNWGLKLVDAGGRQR